MKQVKIFKTDVEHYREAALITQLLQQRFPHYAIHFDLGDDDRILRIETFDRGINENEVVQVLNSNGYACAYLP